MTITEFLLARIADDEAEARAAGAWLAAPDAHGDDMVWTNTEPPQPLLARKDASQIFGHIARHNPARVLRECEAKRWIVARARSAARADQSGDGYAAGHRNAACSDVQELAAVYADHPDYRPEWRPLT